jgi:hypothetical protein
VFNGPKNTVNAGHPTRIVGLGTYRSAHHHNLDLWMGKNQEARNMQTAISGENEPADITLYQ